MVYYVVKSTRNNRYIGIPRYEWKLGMTTQDRATKYLCKASAKSVRTKYLNRYPNIDPDTIEVVKWTILENEQEIKIQ